MTDKPDFGEPWEVDQYDQGVNDRNHKWISPYDHTPRVVACVNACAGLTDEELQRVRAVNEMYEALKACRRIDVSREANALIDKALAKAEGREP